MKGGGPSTSLSCHMFATDSGAKLSFLDYLSEWASAKRSATIEYAAGLNAIPM